MNTGTLVVLSDIYMYWVKCISLSIYYPSLCPILPRAQMQTAKIVCCVILLLDIL